MRLPFNGKFTLTQKWGENPAMYAKFGLKGHNGIDWGMPNGTPILAPHGGVIKEAYYDQYGYGKYIKIENDKEGSVLAHFQEFRVTIGQTVKEGDVIALSDNTGNSTGPHLHWGYYKFPRNRSDGYNGFIDQYPLIKALLEQPISSESGMMEIEKAKFTELITKLDTQEKEIATLKQTIEAQRKDYETRLADKTAECQKIRQETLDRVLECVRQI